MQQQHNEGVGYNGHTVIQPLSHSFKVGKPPNSLFLDTMDFLTMEVVAIVWAAGCWAAVINGPTSALPCLLSPLSAPHCCLLGSLVSTQLSTQLTSSSQASLRTNPGNMTEVR